MESTEEKIKASIDADHRNTVDGDNSARDYLRRIGEQRRAMGFEDVGGVSKAFEAALAEVEKAGRGSTLNTRCS